DKQARGMRGHIFFFSSRRRHTRWPRDWSSDVCSSDLMETGFCANHFEQFMLGDEMGGPHVFGRQTEGTSQTEIVLAPSWDVAVEELSKRGASPRARMDAIRSEEHTSELQSRGHLVCRLLLEKKKQKT